MSTDPAAGAPVALAPAGGVDAARNDRIPFELLAAIALVGAAAAGHPVQAALAAVVVVFGRALQRHRQGDAVSGAHHEPLGHDAMRTHASAAAAFAERALSLFGAWFMPLAIASSAAVLLRTGDVALALTLLLVASPQALFTVPPSSRLAWRALAAFAAAALLGAVLAGFVGLVGAALLHQASALAALAARRACAGALR